MTSSPKHLLLFTFFLFNLGLSAQRHERLTGFQRLPQETTVNLSVKKAAVMPVQLPFEDDFSYNSRWPNPALWADSNVFINQTQAQSPITLGVASFDGLDKFGFAYNLNRQATDTADVLTSREINLSNPTDSVFISFYYQAGGLSEPPSTEDSLALSFWNSNDSTWRSAWSVFGGNRAPFEQVLVYVPTQFYSGTFKFRFTSYGSQAGTFDVWHIDYVRLDDQRTSKDFTLQDIAFTRPHPSLLQNYEALPWFHVDRIVNLAQVAKPDIRLHYRRNVDTLTSRPSLFLGEFNIRENGNLLDQNGQPDANLDDSHNALEEVRFPVPDTADGGRARLSFLPASMNQETTIVSTQTYSGGNQTYTANDTVVKHQHFKNYYAYDDGSAERAIEILNNDDGFIVQRYNLLGSDTLKGIYLYFAPAFYNVENNGFTIIALENNNGLPGATLFESDSVYEPVYTESNFYLPYALDSSEQTAVLNQTVFIGIKQTTNTPLTLGYDANTSFVTTAFYGATNDLFQSFFPGTRMMRPYFRYQPQDLSAPEPKLTLAPQFSLYPNPAHDIIKLQSHNPRVPLGDLRYGVYDLRGSQVASGAAANHLSLNLKPGLYIFKLFSTDAQAVYTIKISIQ
jgi:hypothetical protein